MLTILELSRLEAPPNVATLARALRSRPGLSVLASSANTGNERTSFIASDPIGVTDAIIPAHAEALHDAGPTGRTGHGGHGGAPAAPRFIGVLPYEAFRDLERPSWRKPETRAEPSLSRPCWHEYDACLRIDHATGIVAIEADSASAAHALRERIRVGLTEDGASRSFSWHREEDHGTADHVKRVERVLEFIRAGDVYQVNVARAFRYAVTGDRLEAFLCMMQQSPVPFGFFGGFGTSTIFGASPELALEVHGRNLRTSPIKGTRPRGQDATADESFARALDADEKERAELTMAIDLHRNDLGKIAVPGTVRVPFAPRIVRGARVMSRVADVIAERRADATLTDCVRAMLPCGSVTGAPKIRAMEIISELEPERRGLYTGAYGLIGRDGRMVLAMAIRTAVIDEARAPNEATYFSGGGIVWGSDREREEEETRWKAAHLENLAHK